MDDEAKRLFPPPLSVGNRVWTDDGYPNHGQREGPKVDIAPNQGGTVVELESTHFTTGPMLYVIRWDNGQTSKHYKSELFSIGHFQNRRDLEAAIRPRGSVNLTVGPGGGFRQAEFDLEADGQVQRVTLTKDHERVWRECVEPTLKRLGVPISTTKLTKGQ